MSELKARLDQTLVARGLVSTRSQAESYIKLGYVTVNGKQSSKPGTSVIPTDDIKLTIQDKYVSRAALKLDSVARTLGIDFKEKTVLDVGSSTGGFTDYALQHGAKKVIAVELGTNQMHPNLRDHPRIELHEKTDIRDFALQGQTLQIDVVVIDVSFTSLQDILPPVARLSNKNTRILAMVKPQFEADKAGFKHRGVIKNDRIRRDILKQFESWVQKQFVIVNKADSHIAGAKGNVERFYLLKKL